MKKRSTSETRSEAALKVPITFYNMEKLIKEAGKKRDCISQDIELLSEEVSFAGVLSSLKPRDVYAVPKRKL